MARIGASDAEGNIGKKLKTILITVVIAVVAGAGCSSENAADQSPTTHAPSGVVDRRAVTMKDWPAVAASPDAFEGREVRGLVGRVFAVEQEGRGFNVQMWTTSDFSGGNTMVAIPAAGAPSNVAEDDYLRVDGVLQGSFTGENASGGVITATLVQATAARKITPSQALVAADQAVASKPVRVSQTHEGLVITITRVDRLDDGGRLEVVARNGGSAPVTLSRHDATVLQGDRQLVAKPSLDLPDFPASMQPGFGGTVLLIFPGLRAGPARLLIDWLSDDYRLDTQPFDIPFQVP
jgi:hypothetical protein